jgi:hypothetical protein
VNVTLKGKKLGQIRGMTVTHLDGLQTPIDAEPIFQPSFTSDQQKVEFTLPSLIQAATISLSSLPSLAPSATTPSSFSEQTRRRSVHWKACGSGTKRRSPACRALRAVTVPVEAGSGREPGKLICTHT